MKRRKTAKRYGVSVRSIERWEADPKMGFPKSVVRNGRKYDDDEKLDAWDRECAAAGRTTRTPPATGQQLRQAGTIHSPAAE